MLKKLLKYDFKELLKICIPMYVLGLIASILYYVMENPVLVRIENSNTDFSMLMYGVVLIALQLLMFGIGLIIVGALLWIIVDFYGTVFGKQGYLTHTLPVSKSEILWSKIISASVMFGITVIVTIALNYIARPSEFQLIYNGFIEFYPLIGENVRYVTIAGLLLIVLLVPQEIISIYTAVALGHLTKYNKVMSFVFYSIINNVTSFLIFVPAVIYVFFSNTNYQNNGESFVTSLGHGMILASAISIIMSCILGFITYKIMDKKLNLI